MSGPRRNSVVCCSRSRRGITLVEAVFSIVLVGVLLVAALNTLGSAKAGQRIIADQRVGGQLAEELMTEILAHPYADESVIDDIADELLVEGKHADVTLGPESGEVNGSRSLFDDLDDYHQWSASPPQDRDGTRRDWLDEYGREVEIQLLDDKDIDKDRNKDEGARRITVTVTRGGATVAQRVSVVGIGPTPTQGCSLPDGSCLDLPEEVCKELGGTPLGAGTTCLMNGTSGPVDGVMDLLFVVVNDGSLTGQEQARQTFFESLGYTVHPISASASESDFDELVARAEVAYISEEITSGDLDDKLVDAPIGVVNEEINLVDDFGIATAPGWGGSTVILDVLDMTHYITGEFDRGFMIFLDTGRSEVQCAGPYASGARVLAMQSHGAALIAVEAGSGLVGGGTAAGRRVQVPFSDNDFEFDDLLTDGVTIMQRSIEWAQGLDGGWVAPEPVGPVYADETSTQQNSDGEKGITLEVPSGTGEGDLLLAAIGVDQDQTDWTIPAGWAQLSVVGDVNDAVTLGVFWKIASSSEPSSYFFDYDDREQAFGWMMRFTGVHPTAPIHAFAVVDAPSRSSTPTAPSVTTTIADSLIVRIGAFDDDDITPGDPGLGGHSGLVMGKSGEGGGTVSGGSGWVYQAKPGPTGEVAFQLTASEQYAVVTIAIAPRP